MISIFILGALITTSLLMAWFMSELPVHVFHIFRRLGWRKNMPLWWEQIPEYTTTREDLFDFLAINGKYPLLDDLITCRVCLSFHISFYVSLFLFLTTSMPFLLFICFWLSYPFIANALLTLTFKH